MCIQRPDRRANEESFVHLAQYGGSQDVRNVRAQSGPKARKRYDTADAHILIRRK